MLAEFEDARCYHCQQIAPFIKDLTAPLAGRVKMVKIDIRAEGDLAARFGITATPTFVLFAKDVQLARIDGSPKNVSDQENWALHAPADATYDA